MKNMQDRLGEKVYVTAILTRKTHITRNEQGYGVRNKTWQAKPVKVETPGIIIGIRTLSNGVTYWLGDDAGNGYEPKEYIKAWVVVTDIYKAPILVPFH